MSRTFKRGLYFRTPDAIEENIFWQRRVLALFEEGKHGQNLRYWQAKLGQYDSATMLGDDDYEFNYGILMILSVRN